MANMNLVTGYTGQAHVTAADDGALNAALVGTWQCVMPIGNMLQASVITNNSVRVQDGDALMQGRHIRIEPGSYVDLTIENGTIGYYRNDLIVIRYEKESSTGIESANLVVIKGTPNTQAGIDPSYNVGDILYSGAIANDMPLYRVVLEGLNVKELVRLCTNAETAAGHAANKNNPHNVTHAQVGAAAASHTHTLAELGAAAASHTHTPASIGAASASHTHTLSNLSDVHVCSSTPSSVTNGHWYLVKES